jgi:pimeloyl-ACP methyl ester carboxylesterase
MAVIEYRKAEVDGLNVFYREAGRFGAPTLLLLHGFPSASHMFRALMPQLAGQFHVVAPDLPGFGQSDMPGRDRFHYTFDNIARVIGRFTEILALERFAIYVFDYGAPTGLRMAAAHPERISAIISQNGNAYEEGLSEGTRSGLIGRSLRMRTVRRCAPSYRRKRPSGSIRTACPIRRWCRRTDIRSTITI